MEFHQHEVPDSVQAERLQAPCCGHGSASGTAVCNQQDMQVRLERMRIPGQRATLRTMLMPNDLVAALGHP